MKNQTSLVVASLFAGLLFGLGLLVSGMANPVKVIGFLDLSQPWDPSLMLVMGGAIAVGLPGFWWAKKRRQSLLGAPMVLPSSTQLDRKLLAGAALFGAGWGVGGFCPGPALVAASSMLPDALVFTGAMLAGMALFSVVHKQ